MKNRTGNGRLSSVAGAMAAVSVLFGVGPASSQQGPGTTTANPIEVNCPTETTKSVDVFSERQVHFRISVGCYCGIRTNSRPPQNIFTRRFAFQGMLNDLRDNGLSALPIQFRGRSMSKAELVQEQTIGLDVWLDTTQQLTAGQLVFGAVGPGGRIVVPPVPIAGQSRTSIKQCYSLTEMEQMHADYKAYVSAVVALVEFLEQNP